MSERQIETYKLGDVRVVISEADRPDKVHVDCNDGSFHSEFTVRMYESKHYKRHMNQKIVKAYREAREESRPGVGQGPEPESNPGVG